MMKARPWTIADQVIKSCEGSAAATLYGGYAQTYDGRVLRFPTGHIEQEKRTTTGRCRYLRVHYADGSRVVFTWSEQHGSKWEKK